MIESGHAWTHPNDAPFSWSMPGIEPLHGNPIDMRQRYKKHVFYQFGQGSTRAFNFQPERWA
eukprot:5086731-Alexandrium_andersonii.AAC.1